MLSGQLTHAAAQAIEDLVHCHAEHAVAKFWGVCNEQKWALDACLREEKAINRCVCCSPSLVHCAVGLFPPGLRLPPVSCCATARASMLLPCWCCTCACAGTSLAMQQGHACPATPVCPHSLRICLQQALPCLACRAKNFEKAKRERERLRQKLDAAQAPREGAAEPEATRSTASEPQATPDITQALQASAAPSEAA